MKKMSWRLSWALIGIFMSAAITMAGVEVRIVDDLDGKRTLQLDVDGHVIPITTSRSNINAATVRAGADGGPIALTWNEGTDRVVSKYALSLDRLSVQTIVDADYRLMLQAGNFDPGVSSPQVNTVLQAPETSRIYLVQYFTQTLESYEERITDMGGLVHRFLPNYTHVVEMDQATAQEVADLGFVRWVGPFHVAYKMDAEFLASVENKDQPLRFNLLTMRRGSMGQDMVAGHVEDLGGRVISTSEQTYLMSVELPGSKILELAAFDEVQWIDAWSEPEDDMDIARAFHGADFVESVAGYTGQGVNVEVCDGGTEENHPDMQNYILHTTNTVSNHGTCCSGIVVGTGLNNGAARGVMPDAFLSIADYSFLGNRYNHTSELVDTNGPYRCVLQSNSWGDARTTQYTSISQDMDLILFDHERISILQSQSNAGNPDSRPQAWAKNIISVGGVRHYGTLTKSDDAWAGGGSTGPAADGRLKPDISSFYDSTLCTDRVGSAGYASGDYYSSFGGTSGATPIVAGHLGLIYQMWGDGIFGNPTPGSDAFDARPANTTAKAMLIASATQWTFSGTGHDLTRVHQGWGHPDLQDLYDNRGNLYIVDETDVLTNLQSTVHPLTVAGGTPELKVTMIYRDWPGTTSSSLHRINNMDLKVTSPGGTVYWGNNGLNANMYSTAGGSANTLDTVENVFIQNPQAGVWQVEVIAAELNQDTHPETGALDADYALVAFGVSGTGGNVPPSANFTYTNNVLDVNFTDTSNDPDGTITNWSWTFGDGATSTAQNPSHSYSSAGTYSVSLTVTDNDGATDTITQDVDVLGVTYSLTTSTTGSGSVTLSPAGGVYSDGTVVTVTANPGNGASFIDWSGDLSGSTNPTTITMNSNKSVTANFTAGQETVGNTTVYGSTSTSANRRAMPFTMPEDGTISSIAMYHAGGSGNMILAVYGGTSSPDNLLGSTAATALNSSAGFQTINLTTPVQVPSGTQIYLAWVYENNPGIAYQTGTPGRYDAGVGYSGGMPNPYGSSTQANFLYSIYANYTPGITPPQQYTLTTNTSGNGSISLNPAGGTYNEGTQVTATANPDSGYVFTGWSGAASGSSNPVTVTMDADKTLSATFALAPATVGNTVVYGSTSVSANRRAMPFTMPETGTIQSVTMYHAGGSGNMILAVYGGSSLPDNLLATTAATPLNSAAGWQTINLTSSVSVNSGTQIWLAWVYENNPGIAYQTGSPGRADAGVGYSGGMPDPYGSSTQANFQYSIYATYSTPFAKTGVERAVFVPSTEVVGTENAVDED